MVGDEFEGGPAYSEPSNGRYGDSARRSKPVETRSSEEIEDAARARLDHARMINPRLRTAGVSGAPLDTREGTD